MKSNSPTTKHRFLRSKETSRFKYCRVCGEIRSNSIHGVEETTTKQSDHFPDIKEKVEESPLKEWEEEFDEKFSWDFREISKIPAHKNLETWIKQFISTRFIEKSKVRELLEDEEVPDKAIVQGSEYKGMYPGIQAESRNELRRELKKELEL